MDPLVQFIPTQNALWEYTCDYIWRIRTYVSALFPTFANAVDRSMFRLPADKLQPNPDQLQFCAFLDNLLKDAFPTSKDKENNGGFALWLSNVNTTWTAFAGHRPQNAFTVRENLFFACWWLELRQE